MYANMFCQKTNNFITKYFANLDLVRICFLDFIFSNQILQVEILIVGRIPFSSSSSSLLNSSIHQFISPSQSINRPINVSSADPFINRSIDQSINRSINQSNNYQSIKLFIHQLIQNSTNNLINHLII